MKTILRLCGTIFFAFLIISSINLIEVALNYSPHLDWTYPNRAYYALAKIAAGLYLGRKIYLKTSRRERDQKQSIETRVI